MKILRWLPTLLTVSVLAAAPAAQAQSLTVAYQTVPTPSLAAQADGDYEKATGAKIAWRKFDGGAEVINAVASGDVQIAYLGSSPLAAAISRKLPIEVFLIAAQLDTSEQLVVRNGTGIDKPQDLVGKKVAVPFVSTGHYSLLAALKHWNIDPRSVNIVNLSPPNIAAAWERGDIDATYVWDPALGKVKQSGKVLISSGELAGLGAPTFDAWLVRKDFAKKYPQVVSAFARVTLDTFIAYERDPKGWLAADDRLGKLARISGARPDDIPGVLAGSALPGVEAQIQALGEPTIKALADTSSFLKEQKRIDTVLPDYSPYVNASYVRSLAH
ncbi:MAG: taurine ABC transporter substrate-binding protein [Burkholderiaceae bacterium]